MSLTSENIESRPGLFSYTIFRDIGRMDHSQLDEYVRRAFTGNTTGHSIHLPKELDIKYDNPFFDYWFDIDVHGPTIEGREPPSPAVFLAGFHNTLGSVQRGTFVYGHEGEEQPDFGYRNRFRLVLAGIIREAITSRVKRSDSMLRLLSFTAEAVGGIRSRESFVANDPRNKTGRMEKVGDYPYYADYPDVLKADLVLVEQQRQDMLTQLGILRNTGGLGELRIHYERQVRINYYEIKQKRGNAH